MEYTYGNNKNEESCACYRRYVRIADDVTILSGKTIEPVMRGAVVEFYAVCWIAQYKILSTDSNRKPD